MGQASYSFDPFGRPTKLQETVASDFGFAGYYLHARSGLNLTVARAYSPVLGRFISRDPIAEMGGINLYGYVSNNPLRFVDPGGLQQRYPPCKGRTTPGGFGVSNYSWENQGSPPQNPPLHDPFATGTQTETAPPETESTEDTSWEGEEYFGPKEGPYPDLKPTPEYEGIDNFLDYMQDYHPDPPNWLVEVTLES